MAKKLCPFSSFVSLWMILMFVVCMPLESVLATGEEQVNVFNGEGCDKDELFQARYLPAIRNMSTLFQRILEHVKTAKEQQGQTHKVLAEFVDRFGSRFTATENLENAIDFMLEKLKSEQHDNVHGENVEVPHWTRGKEWATMIRPRYKMMNILGLGYSIGTNGTIIQAPVIVVRSFDELEQRSKEVKGKIVVYNFKFESYGAQAVYRVSGASRAAKHGAIAAMIRSLTPFSIDSPHTGMMSYEKDVPQIPAISITVEDADLLQRFQDRNEEILVQIYSENEMHKNKAMSRNTISELKGTSKPDEVVVISGHLDSWDVGQGAMDDGGGAFIAWRALSILKQLNLLPPRTIRSILWTGEEMGLIGAASYVEQHKNELSNHIVAMESDIGTFQPNGITYSGQNLTSKCILWEVLKSMAPINATRLVLMNEGSDTQLFYQKNIPIISLDTKNENYFYFHHTHGDTMLVETPENLDNCQILWTTIVYAISALDHRFS